MKQAIILHNPVNNASKDDELDVLNQAELIESALTQLGYSSRRVIFDLNTNILSGLIKDSSVSIVFNLVETIYESGRFSFVAPAILELFKIKFTGSDAETIFLTTDKIVCKTILSFNKIITPSWAKYLADVESERYYIIKPISEDGSVGIDDAMIVRGDEIREIHEGYFAEEYIHGREFNISIIGGKAECQVLPLAEMCFSDDYYETRPRILGYKAKWDETSMEFQNTTRSFRFEDVDMGLIDELKEIAGKCWRIFGLRGYARVDVRVGADNVPKVIEINANPCIAPDSGFVAACNEAGLTNTEIIKRIIDDAKRYETGI
ncbi:MAG: ATP-grasp domain-containing protein [Bacteroidia bacterium]|nr:ATP-grasp domain-containing protein [Bacteroidia bacterium]